MPGRRLHRELNLLVGIDDPDMRVQKLLDSTAKEHGPSHRHDAIHSLPGVAAELARRGELTPRAMQAAMAHLAQDQLISGIKRQLPGRGPMKRALGDMVEATLAEALSRSRRRR